MVVEVVQTPTVEAYAMLKQHERDRAAVLVAQNQRLRQERAKTVERAIQAERRSRTRTVATARAQGAMEANQEVEAIFLDEYTRERVRAFEAFPTRRKTYGDIEACAAEVAEYDRKKKGK
jgi:hypothetical protein